MVERADWPESPRPARPWKALVEAAIIEPGSTFCTPIGDAAEETARRVTRQYAQQMGANIETRIVDRVLYIRVRS